jgi:DNA-binding XRE family transcriptional regulator/predicted RNase H-like HicB family nuclease
MHYIAKVSRGGSAPVWVITFPDAPGCQTQTGKQDQVPAVAKEALEGWLESWLVTGEAPPRASGRARKGLRIEVDPALAIAIDIRRARLEQGLTQAEVATRAGVSQQQIAKLEKPGQNPSVVTLAKVGAALGLRPVVTFERATPATGRGRRRAA